MIALQKLWKVFFISSKKLFPFSRYAIFFLFSSSLFLTPLQWTQLSKRKGAWNQWPAALQVTKQVQNLNSFISSILSDKIRWCNTKRFLSYSKNYIFKLCKLFCKIINYSTSICPFVSGKCRKEGKNSQKIE